MRGSAGSGGRATRGLVAAVATALSLAAATNATAQYNKTEPPKTRFRVGPLRFTPKLELRNAGRDTNALLDPTDPLADTSIVVRGTVEGFVPVRRRARLFGEGWLDWSYFRSLSTERSTDPGGEGRAEVDLGPFTLTGAHTTAELRQWVEWSSGDEGIAHYVEHLLKEGGFKQAGIFIAEDTQRLRPLLAIVADPEKSIEVRVGVDALLEAYSNTPALQSLLPQLAELTHHSDHRVRADACNLLGLSGSAAARPYLATCVNDSSDEVREIAAESLELLDKKHP